LITEHMQEVAKFIRRLEEDKTIMIAYERFETIYGLTYHGQNDKYLVLVNKDITNELQKETIWHEAKHIYSHMDIKGDVTVFENEANKFAKKCVHSENLLEKIRTAW
jgi:Zn-dependent peptidase ImmA (M78 family)